MNKCGSVLTVALLAAALGGCNSPGDTVTAITLGTIGGTAVLGGTPTNDIEQVYYLGVLDPQDQLPPTIYRVTLRGQASAISNMRFQSGWVRAELIDSLQSQASFTADGAVDVKGGGLNPGEFQTGRRLVMFGPEGFREAPRNHRLVVLMGSSPEKFFQAVDEVLGDIAGVQVEQADSDARKAIIAYTSRLRKEQDELHELATKLTSESKGN